MSSDKNIEKLIDKYFSGETTLEEEKQLQTFFQGEGIPANLKVYQNQFADLKISSEQKWEGFTEDKLFGKLDQKLKQEETTATKVVSIGIHQKQLWLYRVAAAVALIAVGYFVGNGIKSNNEMKSLRAEMEQMKTAMFSQMESTSASGRLQAVNSSFGIAKPDDEVLDALIERMIIDKNVNVRLKAVESLARFGKEKKVKKALVDGLSTIEEPAVQIALINVLVELKEKSAIENMEKITQGEENLKGVRDEAHRGILKLSQL